MYRVGAVMFGYFETRVHEVLTHENTDLDNNVNIDNAAQEEGQASRQRNVCKKNEDPEIPRTLAIDEYQD